MRFVIQENIEHYRAMLKITTDLERREVEREIAAMITASWATSRCLRVLSRTLWSVPMAFRRSSRK